MHVVANYEVSAECSVVKDDLVLRITHPQGKYRSRIRNIPRTTFATPFLLSVHLYFDAPSLEDARDKAEEVLADCLNMLVFATGGGFRRHRIRQIVDASTGISGVRSLLMWGDAIDHEDPQPFLDEETSSSIERLLDFDMPQPVRRAMRWFRLGVNAAVGDDQFMNFWFALELLAEFQKSPDKENDRCPHCRSPLFCETCKTHPVHKPYAKQAIRTLLNSVDEHFDDQTFNRLDKTRNSLMHGSTLFEIEDSLPQPHEHVVDVLGKLVWKALIRQFPREMFDGSMKLGVPSTFVQRRLSGIAHLQTTVPMDADGDLDLRFTGMKMELVTGGPPQSALGTQVKMDSAQFERLSTLRFKNGEHKEILERVFNMSRRDGESVVSLVLSTDMARIKNALDTGQAGEWIGLFRDILEEGSRASLEDGDC